MTPDFPRITKWLAESDLDEKHAAYDFKFSDPIAPAFEYFLGLETVPGHEEKLQGIITSCKGPPKRNAHLVNWAAFCAELGAIYLLGDRLALPIVGLDQPSPRSPTRNCDVTAEVKGRFKFFEVKRRSTEDLQIPPPLLTQRLSELDLPYKLSIQLIKRDYDCHDLDKKLQLLQEHLDFYCDDENRDLWHPCSEFPPSFGGGAFRVEFLDGALDGTTNNGFAEHVDPMSPDEVSSWLLETGKLGRDGGPMIPMAQQAAAQGADYLMSRVEPEGSWTEFVEEVFPNARPIGSRAFSVDDPALDGLHGIILFSRYDNFFIINSAAADHALL